MLFAPCAISAHSAAVTFHRAFVQIPSGSIDDVPLELQAVTRGSPAGSSALTRAPLAPPAARPPEDDLLYVVTEASHGADELTLRLLDEGTVRITCPHRGLSASVLRGAPFGEASCSSCRVLSLCACLVAARRVPVKVPI